MTTISEDAVRLPWDYFLQKLPTKEAVTPQVEGYRSREWKNIRQSLLQNWRWEIPNDLEPHWVGPGTAVYWQEQRVRAWRFVSNETGEEISNTADNQDIGHRKQVWIGENKWEATGPLPAHAGGLAHYLNKGLRLRPPQEGVAAEILRESADLLEASSENVVPKVMFFCFRHEDRGKIGFSNWGAYLKHCSHYQERATETPPTEVLERAATFTWYCPLHDIGWNKAKSVGQHYKNERRRPGGTYHPTVEDMLVHKET